MLVLVVTLIGHFGDLIINTEHHDEKETAYKIEVEESSASDGTVAKKEEIIEPVSLLLGRCLYREWRKII